MDTKNLSRASNKALVNKDIETLSANRASKSLSKSLHQRLDHIEQQQAEQMNLTKEILNLIHIHLNREGK